MSTKGISETVNDILCPAGFETYPFKIGWYNDVVEEKFKLDYPEDTLAFIVISTPAMFDKAFKPYICRQDCTGPRDPIDQCIATQFEAVKEAIPGEDILCIHDFEMHPNHRPKVLIQTAGHVSGAAYFYQRKDVHSDPWGDKKKIFGVSIHPKYGGWFALRGVIIFKNVLAKDLPRTSPPDVVPDEDQRIELLNRFNGNWQDWTYRDIIPVIDRYSEEQKLYFVTPPKDRKQLLPQMMS